MFFNLGVRLDIIINAAFGRFTDNMIDDESTVDSKKLKLKLSKEFITELFADRKSDYEVKSVPQEINIDWKKYESDLSVEELSTFRSIARIGFFLARKPYVEILSGYDLDLANTLYQIEKDLLEYFTDIAGSFAPVFIYPCIYRYSLNKYELVEKDDVFLKKSYQIGNVSYFTKF